MKLLIPILILSVSVLSWGPRTHIEIARLAEPLLENDIFPDLQSLYIAERGAFYSGTNFPDWANGGITPAWASRAHSMAFAEKFLEVLMDSFPDFSSSGAKRELAFLLGVASHIYGDRVWHSYHTPPGMIGALTMAMAEDGVGETTIEGALDVIIAYENPIPTFTWFWPYETIFKVYHAFGDTDVTISELQTRCYALQTGYAAIITGAGYWSYISSKALIPWTYENYLDYYPGGVGHSSQISVTQWRRLWAKAVLGADYYQRSEYQCGYVATNDVHLISALPTNNTGKEEMLIAASNGIDGRTLLYWDISSFDTSRVIDSALVFLEFSSGSPAGEKRMGLYKLNRTWGEGAGHDGSETTFNGSSAAVGEACWTHSRYGETLWTVSGADSAPDDRDVMPCDVRVFEPSTPTGRWYSWNATSIINQWATMATPNYGFLLKEHAGGAGGGINFPSGENKAVSKRPALVVFSSNRPVNVSETASNKGLQPLVFELSAHPNPFNSAVRIVVDCHSRESGNPEAVAVEIFDINGRIVANLTVGEALVASRNVDSGVSEREGTSPSPTALEFTWQPAPSLPSGVYLVRARIDSAQRPNGGRGDLAPTGQTAVKRVVYLK